MVETDINVAILQTDMNYVKEDIKSIMNNHLPHLNDKIDDLGSQTEKRFDILERKVAYYTGGATVIYLLAQLILKFAIH